MSAPYKLVQWNAYKVRYDGVMLACVITYIAGFIAIGRRHDISIEILLIRAFGTCAFLMLHVILCIGPLCRLDRRFLPLLYNRRHLGVCTFFVALAHGVLATGFYHGFGKLNPLVSLLTNNRRFATLHAFPFELLGVIALMILFAMAMTSHDMWLKTLTPRVWKWLHMMVYPSYALIVMHVALGALQSERSPVYVIAVTAGVGLVATLHLVAGWREVSRDRALAGERVAQFLHNGRVCALTNVCAHQGGPLSEGRIMGGCVTCPWHGHQFNPVTGKAPPPYTDQVEVVNVS